MHDLAAHHAVIWTSVLTRGPDDKLATGCFRWVCPSFDHLACMALLKVNTGCREQEACRLRWDCEVKVPELDTCVLMQCGSIDLCNIR
jgi:hypothetical protein